MGSRRPRLRVGCPSLTCRWRGYRVHPTSRPCPRCGISADKITVCPDQSVVYLLHLHWPNGRPVAYVRADGTEVGWPEHYLGWTTDLERRLRDHLRGHYVRAGQGRRGRGARVVAVALTLGAEIELVRTWRVPQAFETHLKQPRKNGSTRCGASTSFRPLCPGCVGDDAWGRYPEAELREGLALLGAWTLTAPRRQVRAAIRERKAHLERCRRDKAAGVWDAYASWPTAWDRLFPTA
jgi:hypothetical protein